MSGFLGFELVLTRLVSILGGTKILFYSRGSYFVHI